MQKLKQRDLERQLLLLQSLKSNNKMGSNREKSTIAIAVLAKLPFLKGNKNYFAIFADCEIF